MLIKRGKKPHYATKISLRLKSSLKQLHSKKAEMVCWWDLWILCPLPAIGHLRGLAIPLASPSQDFHRCISTKHIWDVSSTAENTPEVDAKPFRHTWTPGWAAFVAHRSVKRPICPPCLHCSKVWNPKEEKQLSQVPLGAGVEPEEQQSEVKSLLGMPEMKQGATR